MQNFRLINFIQTPVAVIDKNMVVVDSNEAFRQKNGQNKINVVATKCYEAAYKSNEPCSKKTGGFCPVAESFKTKKISSTIHHFWVENRAVVEEVRTTPIIEENGEVNYVVEEYRDVSGLLGLKNGIITVCSYCKKVRDTDDKWVPIEAYIQKQTGADFSHGICEECTKTLYEDFEDHKSSPT